MLETREIKITLTDEVWKLLEEKAKRENEDLASWIKFLLITEAAEILTHHGSRRTTPHSKC